MRDSNNRQNGETKESLSSGDLHTYIPPYMSFLIFNLEEADRYVLVSWPSPAVKTVTFPHSILIRTTVGLGIEVMAVGVGADDVDYSHSVDPKTLSVLRKVARVKGMIEIPFSFPIQSEELLRESVDAHIKQAIVSGTGIMDITSTGKGNRREREVQKRLLGFGYKDLEYFCGMENALVCFSGSFWEEYYRKHYDKANEVPSLPKQFKTWKDAVAALANAKQTADFYIQAVSQGIVSIAKDAKYKPFFEGTDTYERAIYISIIQEKPEIARYLLNQGVRIMRPAMKKAAVEAAVQRGYADIVKLLDTKIG